MKFPPSINRLINYLTKLPTVGPKTAERFVFYLLKQSGEDIQQLAQAIAELKENTTVCKTCLAIAESDPCPICSNSKREQTLCVVSDTRDMLTIEATKQFGGYYFILGGNIDTINGITPDKLNLKILLQKLKREKYSEIILALSPTIEGETTAMYLIKLLKPIKIKISRLARGLPTGSNLEYTDESTLANALKFRTNI